MGAAAALAGPLRQRTFWEEEIEKLDEQLYRLAESSRYQAAIRRMMGLKGVGVLTALVFLTEMGDGIGFTNRWEVGRLLLGLVPTSYESGSHGDCKGHITRQGPARVRRILCQATWSRLRHDEAESAVYQRIAAKNPKHKKVAVVAGMRRLGIRMWHAGAAANGREN